MSLRARVTVLAAFLGFLALSAWSSALVPPSCCTAACESCPIVLCKGTEATSASPKVDAAHSAQSARIHPLRLPVVASAAAYLPQILSLPSHEFRRPMRN